MATAILRLPAVKARTGLSRSTIYLRISEGRFPKPVSLGSRAVGWVETEIDDWLKCQIDLSRNTAHCPRCERPITQSKAQVCSHCKCDLVIWSQAQAATSD
ncbi:MAG: AlpA family transcriptional regulator [Candidatus Competibacteraceae bacterium]|nr:AlpA family transcriptional regulator [Candidatus Competibacteraceae bacterium]